MTGGPWARLHSTDLETVKDTAFFQWTRHSSAALGTNGTLKTLGSLIFQNNTTALKKLDFGASHDFTTETTTFLAAENTPLPVEEVWFADEAPSTETLDSILALRTVGDDGTKPVKIYAPMMKASWQEICQPFTDDERTAARKIKKQTGHRVVGVYENANGRVAWLMQIPNVSSPARRAAASSRRAGRRGDASSARGAVPLRGWILV